MQVRSQFGVERLMAAVLVVGLVTFIVVHSYVLFVGNDEGSLTLIRMSWFGGLGLVAVLSVYAIFVAPDG